MVMVMVMVMVMDANEGGRTFHAGDCGIPSSYLNISDLLESKTFEDSFNKAAHPVESAWEGFKFSQFIDKYCGRIFGKYFFDRPENPPSHNTHNVMVLKRIRIIVYF